MKFEFEYEKIKEYENKITKEFGFNSNWEESYYGSYYFGINRTTNKLELLFVVGDHGYFEELTQVDGILRINLNNENKVELEEVDKKVYLQKFFLPVNYLIKDFYEKIYKPNYKWYLPENDEVMKAFYKKILHLTDNKEFKYCYANNIEKYNKYLEEANQLQEDINRLKKEIRKIDTMIIEKDSYIFKAKAKMNDTIKTFNLDKDEENTK